MAKVRRMSIFKKMCILAIFLFGVISLLTSALTAYTLYNRLTQEYLSKGTAIAHSIAGASQEILLSRDAATVQAMIDQYLEIEGVAYVYVLDSDRVVVSHTFVPEIPPRLLTMNEDVGGNCVSEVEIAPFGKVIDICQPILAGVAGVVHVGMDKELILDYFWEAVLELQTLLFVTFVVCVLILFIITRRISRPLVHLTEYAERLANHDFSADIDVTSRDEVGVLARSMKSMGGELATLFASMEQEVNKATGDLREHMAYLSAIIDNLADGLLVVTPSGSVSLVNPVMREYFDLGDKDYTGFAVQDVFPAEVAEFAQELLDCGVSSKAAEIPLTQERTGKGVGSCIKSRSNECLGGVLLVRDITREKELDQLKTDFISTVSHELRTPMTSVLGFAKIIRKKLDRIIFPALDRDRRLGRSVEQVGDNVDIIVSEAERLTDLINDVLDIAKMEAGEIQWRRQLVSMGDVLRQSKDSTRGLLKGKDVEVVLDVEKDLPVVQGDRARLVQVMVNLISNSVKFTQQGRIVCRAIRDGSQVLVSVMDSGVGIPPAAQEDIFDKFKQAGDTLTEKPAGTGLGLPISKQIVEHHGGRIWVESSVGEGSTFSFNLPLPTTPMEEEDINRCVPLLPKPEAAMLVRDRTQPVVDPMVLVVDDDLTLGQYLVQVFEDQGFRVKVAYNGEEAVEKAADLMPNLIIMDLMMPGMDGRTAIRCLRSNPFTRHIPILVLSALSDMGESGGDVALTKPVDDIRLVEVARSLLLEKDIRHSCMVMGDFDQAQVDEMTVICPENTSFCAPSDVWKHIDEGFKGTVFIPAELHEDLDVEKLSNHPDVVVVVLPLLPGLRERV